MALKVALPLLRYTVVCNDPPSLKPEIKRSGRPSLLKSTQWLFALVNAGSDGVFTFVKFWATDAMGTARRNNTPSFIFFNGTPIVNFRIIFSFEMHSYYRITTILLE